MPTFYYLQKLIPVLVALWLGKFSFNVARTIVLARASAEWPSVRGVVLAAYFTDEPDDDGQERVSPNVRYGYEVSGKSYESMFVSYGGIGTSTFADAADFLRGYQKGKPVVVYYDPAKPTRSVLIPGPHTSNVFMALFCAGAWIALLYWVHQANGVYLK